MYMTTHTLSEDKEYVPDTECRLNNGPDFPLLEFQEDSNLAKGQKIKLCHETKYHNREPNTALWEIKVKGGYPSIRDLLVAEAAFALRVEVWIGFPYTGRSDHIYKILDCIPEAGVSIGAHRYP